MPYQVEYGGDTHWYHAHQVVLVVAASGVVDSPMGPPREVQEEATQHGRIAVGARVRVRRSVRDPSTGWGQVSHSSIGTVRRVEGTDPRSMLSIDFPEQSDWGGRYSELEIVGSVPERVIFVDSTREDGSHSRTHSRSGVGGRGRRLFAVVGVKSTAAAMRLVASLNGSAFEKKDSKEEAKKKEEAAKKAEVSQRLYLCP